MEYYAIRVEYQFRGSPHIHCFLWSLNPPILTLENKETYIAYIDSIVHCFLPDINKNKELHDFVKKYQTHRHSKSCRKYKNNPCRYHFGRYFTEKTIVSIPLPDTMSIEEKGSALNKRNCILLKVKQYIDQFLDPSKSTFEDNKSIPSILEELAIEEACYYESLSISGGDDFEIHLRRPANSCFIKNYNPVILTAWQANMDIQPVYNYYRAVSYMCSYFSKSETEISVTMKEASKEVENLNLGVKDAMYKFASAYATSRSLSLQEAVSYCLPEL